MKLINNTRRSILLGVALLGATTFVGLATPASAQPRRDYDTTEERDAFPDRDTAKERPAGKTERQNSQNPNSPRHHRDHRGSGQGPSEPDRPNFKNRPSDDNRPSGRGQDSLGDQNRPRHQGQDRPDFSDNDPQNRDFPNRPDNGEQNRFGSPPQPRDGGWNRGNERRQSRHDDRNYDQDQQRPDSRNRSDRRGQNRSGDGEGFDFRGTDDRRQIRRSNGGNDNTNEGATYSGNSYTGTVTRVRSDQSFDVNIGGNTFNVYTTARTPSGLSKGDTVRINGVQKYNNDIRDARVSVVRHR